MAAAGARDVRLYSLTANSSQISKRLAATQRLQERAVKGDPFSPGPIFERAGAAPGSLCGRAALHDDHAGCWSNPSRQPRQQEQTDDGGAAVDAVVAGGG